MHGFNEDLTLVGLFIAALFVLDKVRALGCQPRARACRGCEVASAQAVVTPAIRVKDKATKTRYFALHAMANAVAAVASFPDMAKVVLNPASALTGECTRACAGPVLRFGNWGAHCTVSGPSFSMVANSAICAIHVYHVLAWKLERADIVHHAVFVLVLCGLAIPFKQAMGATNNFGCFFVSTRPPFVACVMCGTSRVAERAPGRPRLRAARARAGGPHGADDGEAAVRGDQQVAAVAAGLRVPVRGVQRVVGRRGGVRARPRGDGRAARDRRGAVRSERHSVQRGGHRELPPRGGSGARAPSGVAARARPRRQAACVRSRRLCGTCCTRDCSAPRRRTRSSQRWRIWTRGPRSGGARRRQRRRRRGRNPLMPQKTCVRPAYFHRIVRA